MEIFTREQLEAYAIYLDEMESEISRRFLEDSEFFEFWEIESAPESWDEIEEPENDPRDLSLREVTDWV